MRVTLWWIAFFLTCNVDDVIDVAGLQKPNINEIEELYGRMTVYHSYHMNAYKRSLEVKITMN